ncbi:MAG: helix-turn-helix transcriptional regulator [Thermoplasmata archaeon]|nr:helix-turn-helix transcriptional regulator [Thermoplasmata archaeon]
MTEVDDFIRKLDRELRTGLLSLLVLLVVESEPGACYGYQIISKLKELTSGNLVLQEGTIYPILHSLHAKGLVDSEWGTSTNGPPRRYYKLTHTGQAAIEQGVHLWQELDASSRQVVRALRGERDEGTR